MKHNFKNLLVWEKAMILAREVYLVTKPFPAEEKFGLIGQMRRSAVSVPSNIAEGCGRNTNPQLRNFLSISVGSTCELETQILIARDLAYLTKEEADSMINKTIEVRKMIIGFSGSLPV